MEELTKGTINIKLTVKLLKVYSEVSQIECVVVISNFISNLVISLFIKRILSETKPKYFFDSCFDSY